MTSFPEPSSQAPRGLAPPIRAAAKAGSVNQFTYYNPVLILAALSVWCVDLSSGRAGVLSSAMLVVALIWRARLDVVLPLLVVNVLPHDFGNTFLDPVALSVAGFPVSAKLAVTFLVPLRVVVEVFLPNSRFRKSEIVLMVMLLVGLILVAVGTYPDWVVKTENWSRPLRFLLLSFSYFFGALIVRRAPPGADAFLSQAALPISAVLVVLWALGVYSQHTVFFALAIGSAGISYAILRRTIGLIIAAIPTIVGIGFGLGLATFSVDLIVSLGLTLGAIVCFGSLRRLLTRGAAVAALLVVLVFISYVVRQSAEIGVLQGMPLAESTGEQIQFKILGDRASLWLAAYQQIVTGPSVIVPPARPLITEVGGQTIAWTLGAHNVVLESLRTAGVVGGGVLLALAAFAILGVFRAMKHSESSEVRVLAAAITALGLSGLIVGDFLFDQNVGFWFWASAGFCVAQLEQQMHERVTGRSTGIQMKRRLVTQIHSPLPVINGQP